MEYFTYYWNLPLPTYYLPLKLTITYILPTIETYYYL